MRTRSHRRVNAASFRVRAACALLASLLGALAAPVARGCTCAEPWRPPCARYWEADAVFSGRVVSIRRLRNRDLRYRFAIVEGYRGVEGKTVDVYVEDTSCGVDLEKGASVFLYAGRDSRTGRLFTHMCYRVRNLADAGEDVAYAESARKGAPETSLRITTSQFLSQDSIAGVRVDVIGREVRLEGTSDELGVVTIPLAEPGTYSVRFTVPWTTSFIVPDVTPVAEALGASSTVEYSVEIVSGRCTYLGVLLTKTQAEARAHRDARPKYAARPGPGAGTPRGRHVEED